jgi:hypothetical protein
MNSLAMALAWAAALAANERNPTEVDRLASDLIELSRNVGTHRCYPAAQGNVLTEHSTKVYRFGDVGNPDEPNDSARSGNPDSKIEGGLYANAFCYRLRTASSHLYCLGHSLCIIDSQAEMESGP